MFKKWPLISTIYIGAAIAILIAEYVFFTLLSISPTPAWIEPSTAILRNIDEETSATPIKWVSDSAVSPDNTKRVRVAPITDEYNFNVARLVVEDSKTGQQLAYVSLNMPCRIYQGSCHIDKLAWINDKTVAFHYYLDEHGEYFEATMLWEWETSRPQYELFNNIGNVVCWGLVLLGPSIALIIWALRHAREVSTVA